LARAALASALATAVSALPKELRTANILRRADDIQEEYDYIIAGAGTAGLTVADRLTADGKTTVLVIEYCHVGMELETIPPHLFLHLPHFLLLLLSSTFSISRYTHFSLYRSLRRL